MFPTGYYGINTLSKKLPHIGGICQFYFTMVENIDRWPDVWPTVQHYVDDILLKAGTFWYGPVIVPDASRGYTEKQEYSKAGPYYKQRVFGEQPGYGRLNNIVLENMPYHKYIVVAKLRAADEWLVFGNPYSGLDFDHDFESGKGGNSGTAKTVFGFSGESKHKAVVLNIFNPNGLLAPDESTPTRNIIQENTVPIKNEVDNQILFTE